MITSQLRTLVIFKLHFPYIFCYQQNISPQTGRKLQFCQGKKQVPANGGERNLRSMRFCSFFYVKLDIHKTEYKAKFDLVTPFRWMRSPVFLILYSVFFWRVGNKRVLSEVKAWQNPNFFWCLFLGFVPFWGFLEGFGVFCLKYPSFPSS